MPERESTLLETFHRVTAPLSGVVVAAGITADVLTHNMDLIGSANLSERLSFELYLKTLTHNPHLAHELTIHIGNMGRSFLILLPFLIASEYLHIQGTIKDDVNQIKTANRIAAIGLMAVVIGNVVAESIPYTTQFGGDVGFGVGTALATFNTVRGLTLTYEQSQLSLNNFSIEP